MQQIWKCIDISNSQNGEPLVPHMFIDEEQVFEFYEDKIETTVPECQLFDVHKINVLESRLLINSLFHWQRAVVD